MKQLQYLFILCLIFSTLRVDARKIDNPHYQYRTHPTHTILSIDRNSKSTVLEIEATLYAGWFIEIGTDACLLDPQSGKRYTVKEAKGISLGEKCYLPERGKITYKLTFAPLEKGVNRVDFFPFGDQGACKTYGLQVGCGQSIETGSAMLDKIQGNWFATDGSGGWTLGVKGDLIVWNGNFWKAATNGKPHHLTLIDRHNRTHRDTLALQLAKDGSLRVGKVGTKGIHTDRSRTTLPSAPRSAADDSSWSESELFTTGKAIVRGVINGYNPALGWTKGQITVSNAIEQDDRTFVVDVKSDGTFQSEIELPYPSEVMLALNNRNLFFHVAAMDTVALWIEHDDLSRSINGLFKRGAGTLYMGDHARMNREINRYYETTPWQSYQEQYRTKGYRDFEQWQAKHAAQCRSELNAYIQREAPCRKAMDYLLLNDALEHTFYKYIYPSQRAYHLEQDPTIGDRDLNIPLSFFKIPESFPMDDPKLLTIRDSYFFANDIEFNQTIRNASTLIELPTLERLTGKKFPKETYAVADSLKQGLLEINRENLNRYLPLLQLFRYGTPTTQRWARYLRLQQSGKALNDSLKIESGSFLHNMIQASIARRTIDSLQDVSQMALLLSQFSHPLAIRSVLESNERHRPKNTMPTAQPEAQDQQKKTNNAATEPNDGETILSRVLSPYRGKIVYVDFWAMWCGPCRGEMKRSYVTKDLVRDHDDIVFAYISTEKDAPKATREEFISKNSIEGTFLFVSDDEWTQLKAHYNIAGIPHYMIVGKDGKVIDPMCKLRERQLADRLKELLHSK